MAYPFAVCGSIVHSISSLELISNSKFFQVDTKLALFHSKRQIFAFFFNIFVVIVHVAIFFLLKF